MPGDDPRHELCTVTLLDTVTGRTATDARFSPYWWAEGNGSCDCNRMLFLDIDDGQEDLPPLVCCGCKRVLVVACSDTSYYSLREYNEGYPERLVARHLACEQQEE